MELLFLVIGVIVVFLDYKTSESIKENIIKRVIGIAAGVVSISFLDSTYLNIDISDVLAALIIGGSFLGLHIIIARGIKLKKDDVNSGLAKTCGLIYGLELPSEEFVYRGILFIPLLKLINPIIAIVLSSLIFLGLHLKTWNNKFVWFGSMLLGVTCAVAVYLTNSIWTAVIVHNLNDFGYLTLVNKRNIF